MAWKDLREIHGGVLILLAWNIDVGMGGINSAVR